MKFREIRAAGVSGKKEGISWGSEQGPDHTFNLPDLLRHNH